MADYSGVSFDAPAQGIVAMSSGVTVQAGRAILIDCTVSGNITITFGDASSKVINVQANTLYQFNWAATSFTAGTATATVALLK